AALVAVQEIVGDDFVVVVRRVGERPASVAIAYGPDTGNTGAQLVVDGDVAACVGFDTRAIEPQVARVGYTSNGEQQMRSGACASGAAAVGFPDEPGATLLERYALGPELEDHTLAGQDVVHRLRHVLVFARDRAVGHFHDGNAGAEAAIHLRELEPDVARAH